MQSIMNRAKKKLGKIHYGIKNIYAKNFLPKPQIMSVEDTIEMIEKHGYSISRFGDGEMAIIRGQGILFQNANEEMAKRLERILKSPKEKLLIGLPDIFGDLSNMNEHARWFYSFYVPENRLIWYRAIDPLYVYGNSFISRFYIDWIDKSRAPMIVSSLRKMWNNRNIVFIEGEESRLGVGNDLFDNARSIRRIIGAKKNAFDQYSAIFECALQLDKSDLIITALGPTATLLSHDLHVAKFQSLDLGHIDIEYEWLRMGATSKVAIKNKYVNEAGDGTQVDELLDEKYQSQIIAKFI